MSAWNHVVDLDVGERDERERHVAREAGLAAAHPDAHDRAEVRIGDGARRARRRPPAARCWTNAPVHARPAGGDAAGAAPPSRHGRPPRPRGRAGPRGVARVRGSRRRRPWSATGPPSARGGGDGLLERSRSARRRASGRPWVASSAAVRAWSSQPEPAGERLGHDRAAPPRRRRRRGPGAGRAGATASRGGRRPGRARRRPPRGSGSSARSSASRAAEPAVGADDAGDDRLLGARRPPPRARPGPRAARGPTGRRGRRSPRRRRRRRAARGSR